MPPALREVDYFQSEGLANPNLFLDALMSHPDSCDQPGAWIQQVNPTVIAEVALGKRG